MFAALTWAIYDKLFTNLLFKVNKSLFLLLFFAVIFILVLLDLNENLLKRRLIDLFAWDSYPLSVFF